MGLLELPLELLAIVASHTMPYGIETLALTCKALHQWTKPLLPKHNELRKKYRNVSLPLRNGDVDDSDDFDAVLELLAEIAAEPIIAAYMVHVNLDRKNRYLHNLLGDEYTEKMSNKLTGLVTDSPYLAMLADGDECLHTLWLREIVRGAAHYNEGDESIDAEFGPAFLMSLLTNVETVILPQDWCDVTILTNPESASHPVTALLQLLVSRANDPSLSGQPLQRLRAILPNEEVDYRCGTNLERLFPFLALDSMRELIHSHGVYEFCNTEQSAEAPFPILGRNLETIKLTESVVSGDCAELLFKNTENLRVLEMEYSYKDEIGYGFNADQFMEHLIAGTSQSLEKLRLTSTEMAFHTHGIELPLRDFKRLKHLELGTCFLVSGKSDDENAYQELEEDGASNSGHERVEEGHDENARDEIQYDEDEQQENEEDERDEEEDDEYEQQEHGGDEGNEGEDCDEEDSDAEQDEGGYHPDDELKFYADGRVVWRLVTVLPESLESLIIKTAATKRHRACVEQLFWRFEELRAERLPNLQSVKVAFGRGEGDEEVQLLRDFLADKDIVAEFLGHIDT